MMNVLHLLWIIPLSVSFGYATAALLMAAKRGDTMAPEKEEYERIYFEDDHKYSGLLDDE